MRTTEHGPSSRRVLVPVLDGDITEQTFARARHLLARPNVRLVVLHVAPSPECAMHGASCPRACHDRRWRRLVSSLAPGRVIVDVTPSAAAEDLRAEAERFGCDTIVRDSIVRDAPAQRRASDSITGVHSAHRRAAVTSAIVRRAPSMMPSAPRGVTLTLA